MDTYELIEIEIPAAQRWLHDTVKMLVNHEEDISITSLCTSTTLTLSVTVHPGDVGQLIGKQGRIARCLRTLLGARSMKSGYQIMLNIVESAKPAMAVAT